MTDELQVEDRGDGVHLLRLHRPEAANALSAALRVALAEAVELLGARDDVGVLVLTGSGRHFCAGFDLAELGASVEDPALGMTTWASSDRMHHSVLRSAVPIVCALNGPALAGGFDLATLCDLRVAQPGVWFARPELEFAVPLFGPLRELVGGALARELCLTARRVELDEAERVGLVNRVAGEGGAVALALELATAIAGRPRADVRALRAKIVAATGLAAAPTLAL
ncbi:MAG TPA: enoyl-CoA hydratase/isomerase family protein [Iamia sp.]|nr:enoyl-CoA hydratase/isomerase family protein [Iamia sp.]